jgi:monooxygenase
MLSEQEQDQNLPILIIGAGISGLTLAALLHTHSIPCKIFEARQRTDTQGYGITLASWSFDPLLSALEGAANANPAAGATSERERDLRTCVSTDCAIGGMGEVGPVFKDAYTGNPLPAPKALTRSFFRAHRGRLREYMMEKGRLEELVSWGYSLEEVEVEDVTHKAGDGKERGVVVKARFEVDGRGDEEVRGRMLVACDGANSAGKKDPKNKNPSEPFNLIKRNSKVRRILMPDVKLETFPATYHHGERIVPRRDFEMHLSEYMEGKNMLVGAVERGLLWSTIADFWPDQVKLNWGYSYPSPPPTAHQISQDRNQKAEGEDDACMNLATHTLNEIARLGVLTAPWPFLFAAEKVKTEAKHRWEMRTLLVPKGRLEELSRRQHVVLIGDAAHALPVFGGEGGNHAIVDALQLAEQLAAAAEIRTGAQATDSVKMAEAAQGFYDSVYDRWRDVGGGTGKRVLMMHPPLQKWRDGGRFVVWERKECLDE